MRWTTVARVLIAVSALAVALVLARADRERDRCEDATRSAFLASQAAAPLLERRVSRMVEQCDGASALAQIAVGLRASRPRVALRLARTASEREPDSYFAWGVLAVTAPPAEARAAAIRARELNPLSAAADP